MTRFRIGQLKENELVKRSVRLPYKLEPDTL
jgi:hypothetical protein